MTSTQPQATSLQGILIILAAVMPVMAIVTLVPVLPMLGKEFAHVPGSEYLVPAALTIPAFCLAIFSPAAGWLADRIGRKKLLVGSLLVYSVIGVLPFFLQDLKQIIAARFALGITEAAIMTVATTLVGDYFKGSERERWLGIQVGAISVAAVVLVWIGGMLGGTLGSRGPFLLYLFGLPLALFCYILLFEPSGVEEESAKADSQLPLKRLMPLVVGGFLFGVLFYVVIVKLGAILGMKTTITPQLVGQIAAINNVSMIFGSVLFGVLKSRVSVSIMLALATAIMAIGYAGIPLASSVALTVVSCALITFAAGIMLPTFLTWVISMLAMSIRGRGTGLWQGAFFLGQFVAPITVVALTGVAGSLSNALFVYAAISAILLVIFMVNSKYRLIG